MSRLRRNFDAELGAIVDDLERKHLLVVTRESVAALPIHGVEITTKWVSSHSTRGQDNADARTHSAADSEA